MQPTTAESRILDPPARVGVISHLPNITFAEARALAQEAEAAGADWLGLPDAFWWRDSWLVLAEAAQASRQIQLGPLVTNPYLRHPFHTLAALASLQEVAGAQRAFLGLGAGGSEVSGAAGIPRHDAPARIGALVKLLREVERGQPLDPVSGRTLEIPLQPVRVVIAGRGDRVLQSAGRHADSVLLWAIPRSDLARSAALVSAAADRSSAAADRSSSAADRSSSAAADRSSAAADRSSAAATYRPRPPDVIWAPLVDHGGHSRERVRGIAAYSVLNSHPSLHARWGLTPQKLEALRRLLVGGGAAAAQDLVPQAALEDLILADPSPSEVARHATAIGATSIAIPAFTLADVQPRVAWAREVLRHAAEQLKGRSQQ